MAHEESPETTPLAGLTHGQLKELVSLVAEKSIERVEIDAGGVKVKIVGRRTMRQVVAAHAVATEPAPAAPAPAAAPAASAPPAPQAEADDLANTKKVTAPMVGTYYSAPSPSSPPFVRVGDRVDEDSVLCIIEAMKLMNEIKAEMRGVVKRIFVENGQPVEYGQPIVAIEPG